MRRSRSSGLVYTTYSALSTGSSLPLSPPPSVASPPPNESSRVTTFVISTLSILLILNVTSFFSVEGQPKPPRSRVLRQHLLRLLPFADRSGVTPLRHPLPKYFCHVRVGPIIACVYRAPVHRCMDSVRGSLFPLQLLPLRSEYIHRSY